jgi:hypothetical protein
MMTKTLGLANIGIGAAEIAAAEWINDKLGTDACTLTRVVGAHKVATGIGTLALKNSQIPSFARIANNAVHLGLLATAAALTKPKYRPIVFGVLAGVAAFAALDAIFSTKHIRNVRAQHRLDKIAEVRGDMSEDAREMARRHAEPF